VTARHADPQAAVDEAARVLAGTGRPLAEMAVAANDDAAEDTFWHCWRLSALALSGLVWLALAVTSCGATRPRRTRGS
jgi:hypothetical protein